MEKVKLKDVHTDIERYLEHDCYYKSFSCQASPLLQWWENWQRRIFAILAVPFCTKSPRKVQKPCYYKLYKQRKELLYGNN